MFGHRFFGSSYYAPRYFGDGGNITPAVTIDGGRLRRKRERYEPVKIKPEEIQRQQKMVQDYLDELERKARPATVKRAASAPAAQAEPVTAEPPKPRLSEAMARAATRMQLETIQEAPQAAIEDRRSAEKEHQRRRAAATAVLMMAH